MGLLSNHVIQQRVARILSIKARLLIDGVESENISLLPRSECSSRSAGKRDLSDVLVWVSQKFDQQSRPNRPYDEWSWKERWSNIGNRFPLEVTIWWFHNANDITFTLIGESSEIIVAQSQLGFGADQYGNAKCVVDIPVLPGVEVGVSWLMLSATSIEGNDVRVFFPVCAGQWDGVYPEEARWYAREDGAQKGLKGFLQSLKEPSSRPVLSSGGPPHLAEKFARIQKEVLGHVDERQREFQKLTDLARARGEIINFRIHDLALDLPRFPSNENDFESICADWLRAWGHQEVAVTRKSGDFGIDAISATAVCQAKFHVGSKIGRPEIQNLQGAALAYPNRWNVFFAFAGGYSDEAITWASRFNVALLQFDVQSATFSPANDAGRQFIEFHN